MKYNWQLVTNEPNEDIVDALLQAREIDPKDRENFLHPDWDRDTHDPFIFTKMQQAVDRLFDALENREKITIHGDYDADGVSGSALLMTAIRDVVDGMNRADTGSETAKWSAENVDVYLPDREKDGYGVAMHTVERLASEGVKLLITVDCGIANIEEFKRAHALGMDVIICDHHQLAETVPEHALIIHPLAPGETYPNKHLCGTGVAFKFASGLLTEARKRGADIPDGHEKWYLDLVAIATVTDVMPLHGENRTLEKFGLKVLRKSRRPGVQKIMDYARGELESADTTTIGFQIGPRINAAGRIRSAKIAFDALTAPAHEADEYARELEMLNRERRSISDKAYREARKLAAEKGEKPIHVIWADHWMHGIVGLVAGKLVSQFGVPAFALTRVGDYYVGSGRSIGGLHLVEAMRSCGDIFVKAGGHPQACGLTIHPKNLEAFQTGVEEFASSYFGGVAPKPELRIDMPLSLTDLTWDVYHELEKLAPYGQGNPRPKFLAKSLQVVAAEGIGKDGKHLRLTVNPGNGPMWKLIGFGFGKWADELTLGNVIDVVYEVDVNEWNGRKDLQARIEDLRIVE